MTGDRMGRIRELLLAASDLADDERAAFLDRLDAEDADLGREIRSLLAHEAATSDILRTGGLPLNRDSGPTAIDDRFISPVKPGDLFRHYRIEKCIGRGGMGRVYLARDEKLARTVAIKFLVSGAAGSGTAERRFLHEARRASSLDHPNICVIHEIDRDDADRLYIVMAHYGGGSLRTRLEAGALAPAEALRVSREIAAGLSAAHANGIVHRDLKPGNVMFADDGSARIIDFGVAKLVDDVSLTRSGVAPGTIAYMSPEQVRGEPLDARSDLFSLGCLLHEMLTGAPLYRGGVATVLHEILHVEPPRLQIAAPPAPAGLQTVLDNLLSKDPDQRYGSADELLADLAALAADAPSAGTRAGEANAVRSRRTEPRPIAVPVADGEPRVSRGRRRAGIVALILLVVCLGATLGWRFLRAPGLPTLDLTPGTVLLGAFENRSGDPDLDDISILLAAELSQGLEELEGIEVARLAADAPADEAALLARAHALDADAIVRGEFHAVGDTLLLRIRVADGATGERLFSLPLFRAPRDDLRGCVAEARDRLTGGMAVTFASVFNEPVSRAPRLEAARAYVAAQRRLFDRPLDLLNRAIAADSSFTLPLLLLTRDALVENDARADSLLALIERRRQGLSAYEEHRLNLHRAEGRRDYAEALRHARLAEALAPRDFFLKYTISDLLLKLGRATELVASNRAFKLNTLQIGHRGFLAMLLHELDALHLLGRHEEQLRAVDRALAFFPGERELVRRRIRALAALGRIDEVLLDAEHVLASARRPTDPPLMLMPAILTLCAAGDKESSVRLANRVHQWITDLPERDGARFRVQIYAGVLLYLAERWDAAETFDTLMRENGAAAADPAFLGWRGLTAARMGRREEALDLMRELERREKPRNRGFRDYKECAEIAAALGERETAVAYLRRAFAAGLGHDVYLHESSELETLRGYAPYEQLMRVQ